LVVLQRILYVSRAAPAVERADVHGIIRAAHVRNASLGLSGALLFLDGWFAQLIEGPVGPLAEVFGHIAADPRHSGIELRLRAPALGRLFPGQPMALRYRACLDDALLEAFDYRPGFPVQAMPADALTELMVGACHRHKSLQRAAV
jgi:hypothetical protein